MATKMHEKSPRRRSSLPAISKGNGAVPNDDTWTIHGVKYDLREFESESDPLDPNPRTLNFSSWAGSTRRTGAGSLAWSRSSALCSALSAF